MSGDHLRNLLLLPVLLALSSSASASASIDGFVTSVENPTSFDVGSTKIVLAETAQCSRGSIYGIKVLSGVTAAIPSAVYMVRPNAFFRLDRAKERAIGCNEAHVTVGSRVHIVGKFTSAGRYLATKLIIYEIRHPVTLAGNAVLEESPKTGTAGDGAFWIDGYEMRLNKVNSSKSVGDYERHQDNLTVGSSVDYQATFKNGSLVAEHFKMKDHQVTDDHFLRFFSAKNEPESCTSPAGSQSQIVMPNGSSAEILLNHDLQEFVAAVGSTLVPTYQKELPADDASKINFRFCVIRSSADFKRGDFLIIDGTLPHDDPEWGYDFTHQSDFQRQRDLLALPTGLILIPAKALANLRNKAQLAALLSYAITSVLQGEGYKQWTLADSKNIADRKGLFDECLALNEQVIRIGIRQMYLAGFDIREAPWAWAAARGEVVQDGGIEASQTEVKPWYPALAFDYISEFYSSAHFGELQRGKAEYAAFLSDLRRADPNAFGRHGRDKE